MCRYFLGNKRNIWMFMPSMYKLVCREQKKSIIRKYKVILIWLGGKGYCLSVACRNSCGFQINLEPPKYFYPQAFVDKTCYRRRECRYKLIQISWRVNEGKVGKKLRNPAHLTRTTTICWRWEIRGAGSDGKYYSLMKWATLSSLYWVCSQHTFIFDELQFVKLKGR